MPFVIDSFDKNVGLLYKQYILKTFGLVLKKKKL